MSGVWFKVFLIWARASPETPAGSEPEAPDVALVVAASFEPPATDVEFPAAVLAFPAAVLALPLPVPVPA